MSCLTYSDSDPKREYFIKYHGMVWLWYGNILFDKDN